MQAIAKRAHEVTPPGTTVMLFGSQARGDARPDSDWDVLILLDKDKITPDDEDNIGWPIHTLSWNYNESIMPILLTRKFWEENKYTPFHQNVEEDSIIV